MMKKAAVIACTLLFVAAAGWAKTKSPPRLSDQALAAILSQPTVQGSCPATPQSEALFAAVRPAVLKVCGTICQFCNTCDQTGDCFACCRCAGGGAGHCTYICG
jgi:hypothetical protein